MIWDGQRGRSSIYLEQVSITEIGYIGLCPTGVLRLSLGFAMIVALEDTPHDTTMTGNSRVVFSISQSNNF